MVGSDLVAPDVRSKGMAFRPVVPEVPVRLCAAPSAGEDAEDGGIKVDDLKLSRHFI